MPVLLQAFLILVHIYTSFTQPAYAANPPIPTSSFGNDISYPQCGKSFPIQPSFAIVGVNGGRASSTNPCLASQLVWASSNPGTHSQPGLQLYLNTGNPGQETSLTWPRNNFDLLGNLTANPYGACHGDNSPACSWQYGWNRAMDDIIYRFIPASQSAGINPNPASYRWWLDVETNNSWQDGSPNALANNAATLEGMVAQFRAVGASVGLYATHFQWSQIVGTIRPTSNLNGLPNWLPGAKDNGETKTNCQKSPLTPNGRVILTQYSDQFDHNYACP